MLMNGTRAMPTTSGMTHSLSPLRRSVSALASGRTDRVGRNQPMPCDPGKCWAYAHTTFVVLGKVLEKASGRQLDDLIREGILDPLSLNDTRSEKTAIIQAPVLHSFDGSRQYENRRTGTRHGRSPTARSNLEHCRHFEERTCHRNRSAAFAGSHAQQLAPPTAKFKPWSETTYYGLASSWSMAGSCRTSFAGYAATMAYLPPNKLAIAVSVTMGDKASVGATSNRRS